ncbi:hypothetical protein [Streptomyces rapamycinicus]|nr:hypothetical protein [Streptomyces rapamycinicus]
MNGYFAADGATATPAIESDGVAGLYAHLRGGRWSSVISHAWLRMFGVPAGMRVVPLDGPVRGPRVGLATGKDDPPSVLAEALLTVAREAGVRDALDELLHSYLGGRGWWPSRSTPASAGAADRCGLCRHSEDRFDRGE